MEPGNVIPLDPHRRARSRLEVPASLLRDRVAPHFVLFDAVGAVVSAEEAGTVFVSPADVPALTGYLRTHLRAVLVARAIPHEDRAWALHRVLIDEAEALLRDPTAAGAARGLVALAPHLANFALDAPESVAFAAATRDVGADPASRAAETALYAVALAVYSGEGDAAVVGAIALAGVFADAGKLLLPPELAEVRGPLSHDQWLMIREHPERSADLMRRAGISADVPVQAVLAHHERWDGGGYPRGLRHDETPLAARYLAIGDTFTALTVERPFARSRRAFDALLEMSQTVGQFEPRLLRRFVELHGGAFGRREAAT